MKRFFQKTSVALAVFFLSLTTASADTDKPITVNELPAVAQTVISKNFGKHKVALAKVEVGLLERSYDVFFTNGDKIEFDRKGNWTEVACKQEGVPVALVPQEIKDYLKTSQPDVKVIKIERERNNFEVTLSNGIEYTFNKHFKVVDIDR